MHALIIEDYALVAIGLQDELQRLGFASCDIASSKDEALGMAKARCPDVILADYRLVDGTGVEVVRAICADRPIPTIYVAGLVDEVLAEEPLATVLEKPVSSRRLIRAVQEVPATA